MPARREVGVRGAVNNGVAPAEGVAGARWSAGPFTTALGKARPNVHPVRKHPKPNVIETVQKASSKFSKSSSPVVLSAVDGADQSARAWAKECKKDCPERRRARRRRMYLAARCHTTKIADILSQCLGRGESQQSRPNWTFKRTKPHKLFPRILYIKLFLQADIRRGPSY